MTALTAAQVRALRVLAETDIRYERARYRRVDNGVAASFGGYQTLYELRKASLIAIAEWAEARWNRVERQWTITSAGRTALAAHDKDNDK